MSQETIYNLARTNTVVNAWMTNYQYNKDVTYVDALEGIIVLLVEQNDELSKRLLDLIGNGGVTYVSRH